MNLIERYERLSEKSNGKFADYFRTIAGLLGVKNNSTKNDDEANSFVKNLHGIADEYLRLQNENSVDFGSNLKKALLKFGIQATGDLSHYRNDYQENESINTSQIGWYYSRLFDYLLLHIPQKLPKVKLPRPRIQEIKHIETADVKKKSFPNPMDLLKPFVMDEKDKGNNAVLPNIYFNKGTDEIIATDSYKLVVLNKSCKPFAEIKSQFVKNKAVFYNPSTKAFASQSDMDAYVKKNRYSTSNYASYRSVMPPIDELKLVGTYNVADTLSKLISIDRLTRIFDDMNGMAIAIFFRNASENTHQYRYFKPKLLLELFQFLHNIGIEDVELFGYTDMERRPYVLRHLSYNGVETIVMPIEFSENSDLPFYKLTNGDN